MKSGNRCCRAAVQIEESFNLANLFKIPIFASMIVVFFFFVNRTPLLYEEIPDYGCFLSSLSRNFN